MRLLAAILVAVSFISSISSASQGRRTPHEHKAHVHGEAKASMAFDQNKGEMIFEGSGDGFVGFEHKPRNPQQEALVVQAKKDLETRFSEMVQFPPGSECVAKPKSIDVIYDGSHSDFKAQYEINCSKIPQGKLSLNFAKVFTRIKAVKFEFLSDTKQHKVTVKKAGADLEI